MKSKYLLILICSIILIGEAKFLYSIYELPSKDSALVAEVNLIDRQIEELESKKDKLESTNSHTIEYSFTKDPLSAIGFWSIAIPVVGAVILGAFMLGFLPICGLFMALSLPIFTIITSLRNRED